jgi:hypothetical protein
LITARISGDRRNDIVQVRCRPVLPAATFTGPLA